MKHTPGPWAWNRTPIRHTLENSVIDRVLSVNPCDIDEANARLIAAAPELLESLKEFIEDPRFQIAVGGNPNAVQQMHDRAKSAIRKAEGKE